MATRTYGQFCGFARAAEIFGERWALLIVRDLLVSPKRFSDLHRGLPGIPTNVLTARLKELEQAGVIRRALLPRPANSIVYELTEYGQELEPVVASLGRWGAKTLGDPRPDEVITADSIITALRTTFHPERARGFRARYELRLGDIVLNAAVENGKLKAAEGPAEKADLIMETGPGLRPLMAGEVNAREAIKNGSVHVTGDTALLERFAEIFHID